MRGPTRRRAFTAVPRDDTTDADLARDVVVGSEDALAALYERHGRTCFALARRVLVDRALAEEVVQEVFVRLWRAPERFDPERGSMRSFLLAQVHGRAVDLLRAESARRGREARDAWKSSVTGDDLERA